MRYVYGITNSNNNPKGRTITAKQLASIIKRDVNYGKWNVYEGGQEDKTSASCLYKQKGFVHHQQLMIYGSKQEFKKLENLIKEFIEVIPREFTSKNN